QIRILVVDCFHGDVDTASRHGPIRAAKCGTTFWRFWLHCWLFGLAMQCAPPQKRIEFFLLQSVRCARTFLVTSRHVTRRRFPKGLSLRAFKSDNLLRHRDSTPLPPVEELLPPLTPHPPLRSSRTKK